MADAEDPEIIFSDLSRDVLIDGHGGRGRISRSFWNRAAASEKAMTAVIQEAYIQGVSTRSVDELVKAMGMTGISKSQVSRLCVEIDERVHAFLDRRWKANGPISGSTPLTSKCGAAGASSAWQQ